MDLGERVATDIELAGLMVQARDAVAAIRQDEQLYKTSAARVDVAEGETDFIVYEDRVCMNRLIVGEQAVNASRLRVIGGLPTKVWLTEHSWFADWRTLRETIDVDVASCIPAEPFESGNNPAHLARAAFVPLYESLMQESIPIVRTRLSCLATDGTSIHQHNASVYGPHRPMDASYNLVLERLRSLTSTQVMIWRNVLNSYLEAAA
jgi:hypothetical protein